MTTNAEQLYKVIEKDIERKQNLFRIALTNPKAALDRICEIGDELGLKVSKNEVIDYLSTLEDEATKLWLIKVRGGL
tara:strand:- start:1422 stop:1652 length:231 start_codon:yes stop_codon:yes gene_type:complete